MTEKEIKYEKSLWTVKINSQLLYKKYVDGITTLGKSTPEESEEIAEILNKAIADASGALSGRESQREKLAIRDLDEFASAPKHSTWAFRINAQLLFKKTIGGRTILFGMTEKEHETISKIMDTAINNLLNILEERTRLREADDVQEQSTSINPMQMAMDSLQRSSGIGEEIEQAKKELEEAKQEVETKESDTKFLTNDLREEIDEKKASSSKSTFWDKLK